MSKPIVLLDMDGVMVDMTQHHLDAINQKFGTSFSYEDVTDWNYGYMTPEQIAYQETLWEDPELYDSEALASYQKKVISDLRKVARVVAVTSPYAGHASSKWRFLERYFSKNDIYFAKDKTLIAGDVLVDDGPHNIEAFAAAGRQAILYRRPWNNHMDDYRPQVNNWIDMYYTIINCLESARVL